MSLKEQAQQLSERLEVLRERQRRQTDARALDHRRKDWREIWSGLAQRVEQLDWMGLKSAGLAEHGKQVALARSLISHACIALAGGADNKGLTEGGAWAKLEKCTNKTTEVMGKSVRAGWIQLVSEVGSFRTPVEVEASLPLSRPGNREAAFAYRASFARYERLKRQEAPTSVDDVELLRALADELKQVRQRFNYDELPDAVRAFFTAIDSGEGAPLKLLTPEVREWLDNEGQSINFVVKSI